jgi:hypothetical protein
VRRRGTAHPKIYCAAIVKHWYRLIEMKLWEQATTLWRAKLARQQERRVNDPDSSDWKTIDAVVYSCDVAFREREVGVQVWYEYHAEEDHWSGACWIQLADRKSCEDYAAAHPSGSKVRIMYCPGNAGRSVMLDKPLDRNEFTTLDL